MLTTVSIAADKFSTVSCFCSIGSVATPILSHTPPVLDPNPMQSRVECRHEYLLAHFCLNWSVKAGQGRQGRQGKEF